MAESLPDITLRNIDPENRRATIREAEPASALVERLTALAEALEAGTYADGVWMEKAAPDVREAASRLSSPEGTRGATEVKPGVFVADKSTSVFSPSSAPAATPAKEQDARAIRRAR